MRWIVAAAAAFTLLSARPAPAAEDTPHGRVLVCYGMSYGVVELLFAAAENLDQIVQLAKKDGSGERLGGQSQAGARIQSRAQSLLKDLEACLREAQGSAQPDAAAFAVMSAMATELDSAADAIEDFVDRYDRSKDDIEMAAVMEEDLLLAGFADFPKTVKAALDRIEPLFVKVSERSAR